MGRPALYKESLYKEFGETRVAGQGLAEYAAMGLGEALSPTGGRAAGRGRTAR